MWVYATVCTMYTLLKIYQFSFERIYLHSILISPRNAKYYIMHPQHGKNRIGTVFKGVRKKNKTRRYFIEKDYPTEFDAVVSTDYRQIVKI